ncbi:hypothetical protein E3J79_00370 [Candidatus Dependentiae bacterium]|nr:MAG: hypothetical protein E3J79_00370 [Candidatus Dependentiae bacterium]
MHNIIKKYLYLSLLMSFSTGLAIAPYYSIRSQSENAARELVGAGWNTQINLCAMNKWYGNFSITPEYTRSFRPYRIAQCLFGCNSCCNTSCGSCETSCNTSDTPCTLCYNPCSNDEFYRIKISGSQVANRGDTYWLADYFGLPTDYQSCVTFEPRIDNFLVDFNFYLGLDEWCQGTYFRIHAPLVHTRWNLDMCECIEVEGTNIHWPGYFNKTLSVSSTSTIGIARNNLVSRFTSFITGCGAINSNDITFNKLCYAKMACDRCTDTALADIQMTLGWNFWCEEDYHAGLNIRAVVPTGTRPNASYLFEPIVGNGKHWELGGGLTGHWVAWKSEDEEISCAFYLDANVTHLFKAKQCRTFDLTCKPLSRYMLAAKFKTPVINLIAEPDQKPIKQFAGVYTPVANLTTLAVDISVGAQADLVLMFQYLHNNWSFDLGYNFWATDCEKIEPRCDYPCIFEENTWGLKGDAFMYGFTKNGSLNTPGIALSATQSKATLCKGTNNYPNGNGISLWAQNPGIDNPAKAWDDSTPKNELYIFTDGVNATDKIFTSLNPVFINFCNIDLCGARTKGISHKLFAHADYTWKNREEWIPYLGIGGELELAYSPYNNCCNNYCNSSCEAACGTSCGNCRYNPCYPDCCCNYCAVSQWGVWLKGGIAFN